MLRRNPNSPHCYDGNGNVAALVNAADGSVAAQYEYGPFGEVIRATGPLAFTNPFRFSSKYQDDETACLYYGLRFYNPSIARWLSRDPIAEKGGLNVYSFVRNNPVMLIDMLGRCTPGCNRASCVVRVLPAGYSPDTKEQVEELAHLYTATHWFGLVLAAGQTAAAGLGELEEIVATGVGEAVGHGLATPGQAIEHTAKDLLEKFGGDHYGWIAWIFVSYQACESRCAWGKAWTGEPGYWRNLAGSKEWEKVATSTPITEGFDDPKAALSAGNKRCDEKTADFRHYNKMCN
jgi:RHS repeat-associated protein